MRYGSSLPYSTSPNLKSPISPVGSVSAGLSSDGTGSSNSINCEPLGCNGEHGDLSYPGQVGCLHCAALYCTVVYCSR